MTKEIYYDLLMDVHTGRRFYAEYSKEAAEWYEKDNGKAHSICDVSIIKVDALRVDITKKKKQEVI